MRPPLGSLGVHASAFSLLFFVSAALRPAEAQGLNPFIDACGNASELQTAWCQQAVLATQAAQGALGLAASGGVDLPGSASTLGWRTKGSPRFALSARGSLTRAPMASLVERGSRPRGGTTSSLTSLRVSGTVGVFDGFSLAPTVGGIGSVDLTASAQWIDTPEDQGFRGREGGWGLGARIGILRESFSLPGVTFSAFYRSLGEVGLWDLDDGDPTQMDFDLAVRSLRGIIGKDLWGIGFFGGTGWDRYCGDATITVSGRDPGQDTTTGIVNLRSGRRLYFLGGSMTFLTFQISAEVGFAQGFDPAGPLPTDTGFDPGGRSEFGSLALRLTF